MKKIFIVIVIFLIGCGESGKVKNVFNNMQKAASEGNFNEYVSYIDLNSFSESVADRPLTSDEDRKYILDKLNKLLYDVIVTSKMKKNFYSDLRIDGITVEGTTAQIKVISQKYYSKNMNFRKFGDDWKFVSYSNQQGPKRIEATLLQNEFDSNGIAASEKYKDQIIALSGQIVKIDKDKDGKTFISLKSGFARAILCYIDSDYLQDIVNVSSEQSIKVTGIFGGRKKFDIGIVKIDVLFLKDCIFSVN